MRPCRSLGSRRACRPGPTGLQEEEEEGEEQEELEEQEEQEE